MQDHITNIKTQWQASAGQHPMIACPETLSLILQKLVVTVKSNTMEQALSGVPSGWVSFTSPIFYSGLKTYGEVKFVLLNFTDTVHVIRIHRSTTQYIDVEVPSCQQEENVLGPSKFLFHAIGFSYLPVAPYELNRSDVDTRTYFIEIPESIQSPLCIPTYDLFMNIHSGAYHVADEVDVMDRYNKSAGKLLVNSQLDEPRVPNSFHAIWIEHNDPNKRAPLDTIQAWYDSLKNAVEETQPFGATLTLWTLSWASDVLLRVDGNIVVFDRIDTRLQERLPEHMRYLYSVICTQSKLPVGTRTDIMRFFILYWYGGVYMDLTDARPLRDLTPLRRAFKFFGSTIIVESPYKKPVQYSLEKSDSLQWYAMEMAVIGSEARHPVIESGFQELFHSMSFCHLFRDYFEDPVADPHVSSAMSYCLVNAFFRIFYSPLQEMVDFVKQGKASIEWYRQNLQEYILAYRIGMFPTYCLLGTPETAKWSWTVHSYARTHSGDGVEEEKGY